jgi:hypothetical protein
MAIIRRPTSNKREDGRTWASAKAKEEQLTKLPLLTKSFRKCTNLMQFLTASFVFVENSYIPASIFSHIKFSRE